jgi:hypothetical protein
MNKRDQLKQSLKKVGIDLDRFQRGEKLTSQILEKVKGGVRDPKNCSHEKSLRHQKFCHSKQIHSRRT